MLALTNAPRVFANFAAALAAAWHSPLATLSALQFSGVLNFLFPHCVTRARQYIAPDCLVPRVQRICRALSEPIFARQRTARPMQFTPRRSAHRGSLHSKFARTSLNERDDNQFKRSPFRHFGNRQYIERSSIGLRCIKEKSRERRRLANGRAARQLLRPYSSVQ